MKSGGRVNDLFCKRSKKYPETNKKNLEKFEEKYEKTREGL